MLKRSAWAFTLLLASLLVLQWGYMYLISPRRWVRKQLRKDASELPASPRKNSDELSSFGSYDTNAEIPVPQYRVPPDDR